MKLRLIIRYFRDILKKKSKKFKIKRFTIINLIKKNKNKIKKRLKALKKTKLNKTKKIDFDEKSDKNKGKVKKANKNEVEKLNKDKDKVKKANKNEIEETKSKKVKEFKIIILSKIFFRTIEFYKCLYALYAFDFTTLMQTNVFKEVKKLYKVFLIREIINKMRNNLYEKNYDKLNFETHIITRKNMR